MNFAGWGLGKLAGVEASIPRKKNRRIIRLGCSLVGDRALQIALPLANRKLRHGCASEFSGATACTRGSGAAEQGGVLVLFML